MKYGTFKEDDVYRNRLAGATVLVRFIRRRDSADFVGFSGLSIAVDAELIPIETTGNRKREEIVFGRISPDGTLNGFTTAEMLDRVLPSTSMEDDEFDIVREINQGDAKGVVIQAYMGVKIGRGTFEHGARGVITFSISTMGIECIGGEEWAKRTGQF